MSKPGTAGGARELTAQGQISVPAEIRSKLGVGPGAVLEWEERGGLVIVRRAGKHSSSDVHAALFGSEKPTLAADVNADIRKHLRKKQARR